MAADCWFAWADMADDWTADVVVDKLAPWPSGILRDAGIGS